MSMGQNTTTEVPRVVILRGPFKGFEGPVVGVDQQSGTVQVRVSMFGKKETIITMDVRNVRRVDGYHRYR